MTRILLHPQLLPRTGPDGGARVSLTHPWRWWRIKLRPSPGGAMYRMVVDHPTDIAEASILFDLSVDYDIVDPPAMHITEFAPELNHIICGADWIRTLPASGPTAQCDVVWYERPGDWWHQLPGNTCRPGDYQIAMRERDDRDDSTERRWEGYPPLRVDWPAGARLATEARAALRSAMASLYGLSITPQGEIRGWENAPRIAARSPDVLPESEVVDEIDRLVNEQLKPGPRDDYRVDRYEKCEECGHDWHGLECQGDECYCINTDWLQK